MCGDRPRATSAWVVPAVSYFLPRGNKDGGRDRVRIRRGSRETREKSDASPSHQVHAIITESALCLWSGMKKALTDPQGRQSLSDGLIPRLSAYKWPTDRLFAFASVGGL